jgi:hypothetical protein
MKCLKCGKAISRLSETVNGLQQIGPVCAKDIGIHVQKTRKSKHIRAHVVKKAQEIDESQLDLFGEKNEHLQNV